MTRSVLSSWQPRYWGFVSAGYGVMHGGKIFAEFCLLVMRQTLKIFSIIIKCFCCNGGSYFKILQDSRMLPTVDINFWIYHRYAAPKVTRDVLKYDGLYVVWTKFTLWACLQKSHCNRHWYLASNCTDLQWHHMNIMGSQMKGKSIACSTNCSD